MKNNLKMNKLKTIFLLTCLFTLTLLGCLPPPEKVVIRPQEPTKPSAVLPADLVDKKIAYLSDILKDKTLNHEDRTMALELLGAYKKIREASQGPVSNYDPKQIIRLLFNQLNQLDEKYFSKKDRDKQPYSDAISIFSFKRRKILDAYLSGDHQGVIDGCIELEAAFGPDSLTPELGLFFALSLAKKGMLKEAVEIGEKIVRELDGKPDLTILRANIIQWQMELGNREKAIKVYDKLTDSMDEMNAIFHLAKRKVTGEGVAAVHHKKTPPENLSSRQAVRQDTDPMEKILKEVEILIRRHAFDEAKLLLIKQRLRTQEGPDLETIDQALKTIELAEERLRNEEDIRIAQKRETLKMAKRLIEEENYEKAITQLEELKEDQDVGADSKALRDLAIERLINRERNRAARFFLQAKKTVNPQKKEELLFSSYNILKGLIEQYPSSNLIDKLNKHLSKVKEELMKLGKNPG